MPVSETEYIKGTVVAVLGDNLGQHEFGGFTQNVSTSHYFYIDFVQFVEMTFTATHTGLAKKEQLIDTKKVL